MVPKSRPWGGGWSQKIGGGSLKIPIEGVGSLNFFACGVGKVVGNLLL